MNKFARRLVSVFVLLVLWVFFLLEEELAFYGIYSLISYRVHEISSIIPLICLSVTLIWIIIMIKQIVQKKTNNIDKLFSVFLIVLLLIQIEYFYIQSQKVSATMMVTIESVNAKNSTITITNANGDEKRRIVLTAPDLFINMVEINDKRYLASYRYNKNNPSKGKLSELILVKEY